MKSDIEFFNEEKKNFLHQSEPELLIACQYRDLWRSDINKHRKLLNEFKQWVPTAQHTDYPKKKKPNLLHAVDMNTEVIKLKVKECIFAIWFSFFAEMTMIDSKLMDSKSMYKIYNMIAKMASCMR